MKTSTALRELTASVFVGLALGALFLITPFSRVKLARVGPSPELCRRFSSPVERFELGFRGLARHCELETYGG